MSLPEEQEPVRGASDRAAGSAWAGLDWVGLDGSASRKAGETHFCGSNARLSAPIRNYGDVFVRGGYATWARAWLLSLARRAARSRRVKVQWKGTAICS